MTTLTKSYLSTIEEAAESTYKHLELIGNIRLRFLKSAVGLILFSIVPTVFFPYSTIEKVKLGLTLYVLYAITTLFTIKTRARSDIRRSQIHYLGTDQPIPSEYRLSETGATFTREGISITFFWPNIIKFNNESDALELISKPAGIMRIPKRVFSETELAEWISFINLHHTTLSTPKA